ncbi:MAG TPA: preprotein translocase subunit SecE [Anaerolineales bacterium]|jgi:preprotein translocase subunit SecE|nr:preprotein translocase subunit SecE [Anaerolineales bacterium]
MKKEFYVAKANKKPVRRQENAVQRFFRETMGELRKVSWPTRQEATNLTVIVLIVIAAMSVFMGVLDFLYSRVFILLLGPS